MQEPEEGKSLKEAGLIVRFVREKLGISQLELAHRARLSQSSIANLERGGSKVGISAVTRVWSALHLHPRALQEEGLSSYVDSSSLRRVFDKYGVYGPSICSVYCSVIDAYCAILPPKAVKQIPLVPPSNYLSSKTIFNILSSFSRDDIKEIFYLNEEYLEILADFAKTNPIYKVEEEILSAIMSYPYHIIKSTFPYPATDPFLVFIKKLKLKTKFTDYFSIIDSISVRIEEIKFVDLSKLDSSLLKLIDFLKSIIEEIHRPIKT